MKSSTSLLSFCIFVNSALSEITCGICSGYDRGVSAYFYSGDGSLADFDGCSAKCQSDTKCQSFAFGDSQCLLYSEPLEDNFRKQSGSPFLFYDRNCVNVEPTSSFTTVLPATTSSSATSKTAQSETTTTESPAPASEISEASGGTGISEAGSVSSSASAASAMAETTVGSAGGQVDGSITVYPVLATTTAGASTSSGLTALSGTAQSASTTKSPAAPSQVADSVSGASVLLHGSWQGALLATYLVVSILV
ncbi:hypothetical protein VPNG_09508 [Cytospora leucostoma]|uniref:Apple domain-containing protein n=1 Tax=Cytospora leucostoma TaxID=1230097 RepID=A0A423VS70_9PEZI|nr:hypothetical protein VPNG_09508 [Cytospora leucostoma]